VKVFYVRRLLNAAYLAPKIKRRFFKASSLRVCRCKIFSLRVRSIGDRK
jgi:hypothetical protein